MSVKTSVANVHLVEKSAPTGVSIMHAKRCVVNYVYLAENHVRGYVNTTAVETFAVNHVIDQCVMNPVRKD